RNKPILTEIKIGNIRVKINSQYKYFAETEGFAEINPSKVTVLVQAGEFAEDIDTERAEAARGRAEELLQQSQDEKIDRYRAELSLQRALNRINVAQHR